MPPSRKRQLLALYVDYLLFTGLFVPAAWLIERASGRSIHFVLSVLLFLALRIALTRLLGSSPGSWALGIRGRFEPSVDAAIFRREAWWTMLVGTLLVLEGSKNLVRWTQGLPPMPILGTSASNPAAFAAISLLGLGNLVAGLHVLRTNLLGPVLGGAVVIAELIGALVNREALQSWAARATSARRELQGLPVREGQIEFMQALATTWLPLIMALNLVCLLLTALRFRYSRAP